MSGDAAPGKPSMPHEEEMMHHPWRRGRHSGQNLVEYSLIILLVVLAVIFGLALIGPALGSIFSNVVPAL
jgi:pilus assembly protein Flp/PilA